MATDKKEYLFKVLVIGELGVGKTSIIKRYVHQLFSHNYRATIGVDFALKVLTWDADTLVRLQLWDIAGQERFGNMTRVYYKEAVGAFVVFDVTRSSTFEAVAKWKSDLDAKVMLSNGGPIPAVLLANKSDQAPDGASAPQLDAFCKEHGFTGWFHTSAKENKNIDEAARFLVGHVLSNEHLLGTERDDTDTVSLEGSSSDALGAGGGQRAAQPQRENLVVLLGAPPATPPQPPHRRRRRRHHHHTGGWPANERGGERRRRASGRANERLSQPTNRADIADV
uniref:Ras-related protein Rab n=1 Tax=Petromyzon marinus TaxID=7757 RepID=A0AAJ7XDM8_PETMA|nr:ras-related protein Rab-32-like isoform X2 [Petromyzon marinus]